MTVKSPSRLTAKEMTNGSRSTIKVSNFSSSQNSQLTGHVQISTTWVSEISVSSQLSSPTSTCRLLSPLTDLHPQPWERPTASTAHGSSAGSAASLSTTTKTKYTRCTKRTRTRESFFPPPSSFPLTKGRTQLPSAVSATGSTSRVLTLIKLSSTPLSRDSHQSARQTRGAARYFGVSNIESAYFSKEISL